MVIERVIEWLSHVRSIEPFPRDFGFTSDDVFHRFKVADKIKYFNLLKERYALTDCYTSLFSDYQIEHKLYDVLFLETEDWAVNAFEDIISNAKEITDILDKNGYAYRMVFSGARSIHFYISFEPTKIENYKVACRKFVKDFGLSNLIDRHVVGNVRQMVRIPYTINKKSLLFATPIDDLDNFNPASAIVLAPNRTNYKLNNGPLVNVLKSYDTIKPDFYKIDRGVVNISYSGAYPACIIKEIYELIEYHHLSHESRYNLASFLFKVGESIENITELFKYASDYNYNVTYYQLNHIREGGYLPMSCARLKEIGDCPYEKQYECMFYPKMIIKLRRLCNVNGYMGRFK